MLIYKDKNKNTLFVTQTHNCSKYSKSSSFLHLSPSQLAVLYGGLVVLHGLLPVVDGLEDLLPRADLDLHLQQVLLRQQHQRVEVDLLPTENLEREDVSPFFKRLYLIIAIP